MSFRWSEFEEVAKELEKIAQGNTSCREGAWRSAIGRLYYAAFGQVRKWAIQKGFRDPRTGAVHGNLIDFVNKWAPEIATCLRSLHERRKMADYDACIDGDMDLILSAVKKDYGRIIKWLRSVSENMLESEEGLGSFSAMGDIPA